MAVRRAATGLPRAKSPAAMPGKAPVPERNLQVTDVGGPASRGRLAGENSTVNGHGCGAKGKENNE